MEKAFQQILKHLGRPSEQKTEDIAVLVVYCMFLSFALMVLAPLLILL